MNLVNALFSIAEHTLSIYDTKTSRKYLDEVIMLKKVYYYEENKDDSKRNHAVMDNVVNRLCIISESFAEFKE